MAGRKQLNARALTKRIACLTALVLLALKNVSKGSLTHCVVNDTASPRSNVLNAQSIVHDPQVNPKMVPPIRSQEQGYVPPSDSAEPMVRSPNRLIICCDGTWEAADHATHEVPSNVAKLSRAVAKSYMNKENQATPQIVHYDAGVATADWFDSKVAGYFGWGLDENVCAVYNFLANNYVPGDELFFFGFSRGAYTVRAAAGLVAEIGICQNIEMSRFWEMYSVYKTKDAKTPLKDTTWGKQNLEIANKAEKDLKDDDMITISKGNKEDAPTKVRKGDGYDWLQRCQNPVTIKIVGVFDTVGALGFPENRFFDPAKWNKAYAFHNTEIHPGIENAFQALALDEERKSFSPTLWTIPPSEDGDTQPGKPKTNLVQCWFPGVHVNVGGGSDDSLKKTPTGDLETMANTTFAWMVDRCRPFLRFEEKALNWITAQYYETLVKLLSKATSTNETGWGIGPYDKNELEGLINWAGGEAIRTPGHYPDKPHTNEYMHPVIFHAQQSQNYNSKALEGFRRVSNGDGMGYSWVKTYHANDGRSEETWTHWAESFFRHHTVSQDAQAKTVTVTIPEFVIPHLVVQQGSFSHQSYYASPLERLLVLKFLWTEEQNRLAFESGRKYVEDKNFIIEQQSASEYLMQLDRDNEKLTLMGPKAHWGDPAEEREIRGVN